MGDYIPTILPLRLIPSWWNPLFVQQEDMFSLVAHEHLSSCEQTEMSPGRTWGHILLLNRTVCRLVGTTEHLLVGNKPMNCRSRTKMSFC